MGVKIAVIYTNILSNGALLQTNSSGNAGAAAQIDHILDNLILPIGTSAASVAGNTGGITRSYGDFE